MKNSNLFAALRAAFPGRPGRTAIETADGPGAPLHYRWRDLERGTAMLANLLASLDLPDGARVAVQTEKSVEALMLYLAVLRAGYVYLPLNTAYQAGEIEYFIGNAEPGVVVCSAQELRLGQQARLQVPARRTCSRSTTTARGSLLDRAALMSDRHEVAQARRRPGRHPLHQRHHRAQQGRDADAWQPAEQRAGAQGLLGLARRRRADPRAADLPCARPVRGLARRAAGRREDDLVRASSMRAR